MTHMYDLFKRTAQRRVRDLANPEARDSAQDLRDLFDKVQTTIETVDRALLDEQANAA